MTAPAPEKAAPIPAEEVERYIAKCNEMSEGGRYSWWSRLAEILADRASQEERIREDLERLEKAATEVSRLGAVTGPQWSRLSVALGRARARQRGDAS